MGEPSRSFRYPAMPAPLGGHVTRHSGCEEPDQPVGVPSHSRVLNDLRSW